MDALFGGSESQQSSTSQSGFGALPANLQALFSQLGTAASPLLTDPGQFFAPQGLSADELAAGDIIRSQLDPTAFGQSIEQFMNPFRDIITQDINKAFEGQQGALASRISEAGAFGSSRQRGAESDLERSRLDAIASAMSGQFNTAMQQRQQGIGNLLGFGQLERGVDLSQRQALPQALQIFSQVLSPLLSSGTSTSAGSSGTQGGVIPGLSGFFG